MLPLPIPSMAEVKIIALLVGVSGIAIGAATITHKVDLGTLERERLAVAQAHEKTLAEAIAKQRDYDRIALSAAEKQNQAQAAVTDSVRRQLAEVKRHVQANSHCITYGLVRVLNAAATGATIDDALPRAAGKPDDACAPVTAVDLAANIVGNYGDARRNAAQIEGFRAFVAQARDRNRGRQVGAGSSPASH